MTITLGTWAIPTLISMVLFLTVAFKVAHERRDAYAGIMLVFGGMLATIVSLASWLLWALFH